MAGRGRFLESLAPGCHPACRLRVLCAAGRSAAGEALCTCGVPRRSGGGCPGAGGFERGLGESWLKSLMSKSRGVEPPGAGALYLHTPGGGVGEKPPLPACPALLYQVDLWFDPPAGLPFQAALQSQTDWKSKEATLLSFSAKAQHQHLVCSSEHAQSAFPPACCIQLFSYTSGLQG